MNFPPIDHGSFENRLFDIEAYARIQLFPFNGINILAVNGQEFKQVFESLITSWIVQIIFLTGGLMILAITKKILLNWIDGFTKTFFKIKVSWMFPYFFFPFSYLHESSHYLALRLLGKRIRLSLRLNTSEDDRVFAYSLLSHSVKEGFLIGYSPLVLVPLWFLWNDHGHVMLYFLGVDPSIEGFLFFYTWIGLFLYAIPDLDDLILPAKVVGVNYPEYLFFVILEIFIFFIAAQVWGYLLPSILLLLSLFYAAWKLSASLPEIKSRNDVDVDSEELSELAGWI